MDESELLQRCKIIFGKHDSGLHIEDMSNEWQKMGQIFSLHKNMTQKWVKNISHIKVWTK